MRKDVLERKIDEYCDRIATRFGGPSGSGIVGRIRSRMKATLSKRYHSNMTFEELETYDGPITEEEEKTDVIIKKD